MNVYVTGIGLITAIGNNVAENLQALLAGRTGIAWDDDKELMLGKIQLTNSQLEDKLDVKKAAYSRTSLLSIWAAREALSAHGENNSLRTGIISATSVGGIDRTEKFYFAAKKSSRELERQEMLYDNGQTTEVLAKELGISGFVDTISTACSAGANAIMQGARLISAGILDRVLVGGVDPITTFNIKGFSSLNIYSQEICKPFDQNRQGLNLGEGAAFLVLENEKGVMNGSQKALCTISGWNNSSDAFHQTASSPQGLGAQLTMRRTLAKAQLSPTEIDYINAHGTGTINNDLSESRAIAKVFEKGIPPFSSTKGFTGHTLAASGAIEAVFCVLSLIHQFYLPSLNFSQPMEETEMQPVIKLNSRSPLKHILSNSFGFGGNCTSLIFSKT